MPYFFLSAHLSSQNLRFHLVATAYIFADIFDEYVYRSEDELVPPSQDNQSQNSQHPNADNAAFEIPLNTLIECLNIFGTAGASGTSSSNPKFQKWRHADDNNNSDDADDRNNSRGGVGRIDQYFSGSEKRTGMRLSYAGAGYPLTLLVLV